MPTGAHPVAIDVTPLVGVRTGIGVTVAEIIAALGALDAAPPLVPYALSIRARSHRSSLPAATRFVPLPARLLLASWTRADHPRIDRFLGAAELVHATNYLAPPSRHPTLVSVYDCSFVRYPDLCTPEVRAFEPALRRAVSRGATIHTTSAFVASEIEDIFGPGLDAAGRIEVVPLGVPALGPSSAEIPDEVAGTIGEGPYVLAIGTLEPRKNLPLLVRAFGSTAGSHPGLRLVLAGPDGPARPDVDSAVMALPPALRSRVAITGPVGDAARRALLDNATVLAYPSVYEGFGFPVLEAMACDVPVVAARSGAVPEVAGDGALLVDPADEAALAAALDSLLSSEDLRRSYVDRGRERVHLFEWSATAAGLAAVYERMSG
ncbi:MAG: glycosyltransferase family 4 protein [Acidimicrobiia bacterium]|nr:glycosyltransferase family 4 protein [Acidimicrobiia bacterium]